MSIPCNLISHIEGVLATQIHYSDKWQCLFRIQWLIIYYIYWPRRSDKAETLFVEHNGGTLH